MSLGYSGDANGYSGGANGYSGGANGYSGGARLQPCVHRIPDVIVRAVALVAAVLMLAYPVRTFLGLDGLPILVRLAWLLAAIVAIGAPHASLLAFAIGAPLLPMIPFHMGWPRVALAELWLFALLAPALLQVVLGRRPWRAGLPIAVPLIALLATASLIVTLYPFHLAAGGVGRLAGALHQFARDDLVVTVSQRHPYASVLAWAILIEGLALLWLIASHVRGRTDAVRRTCELLVACGAGATCVALQGIAQWWTGRNLLELWAAADPLLRRVNATFSDPNGLGTYLAMSLWLAIVSAALVDERRWQVAWAAAAMAVAAALVFTGSRAAWAAAAIGAVLFVAGVLRYGVVRGRSARLLRRALMAAVVGGVAALAALSLYATIRDVRHSDQRTYVHTLLYTLNARTPLEERLKGRFQLWAAAERMIAARPVFGIGVGRYYKTLWTYAPDRDKLAGTQENAHNYFLQIGAELGLAGVLALAAIIVAAIRAASVAAGGRNRAPVRVMAVATGVAIVAQVLTWLTGHPLLMREGQFTFWPAVAGALLLRHATAAAGDRQALGSMRLARGGAWLAAALILALVPWRAARETRQVRLADLTFGLYDREVGADGRAYHWSTERAAFYVPSNAGAFTVPLRSLAPFPQRVRVLLDGVLVDRVALTDHAWRVLRYQLPARRSAPPFYRVEIVVDPVWRPSWDSRTLGVMIDR